MHNKPWINDGIVYWCICASLDLDESVDSLKSGPLFTKRTDVLPRDFVKSRSREIRCYNHRIDLKIDMHLDSTVAEVPVKFHSDWKSLNPNRVASRLHEILRYDVRPLEARRHVATISKYILNPCKLKFNSDVLIPRLMLSHYWFARWFGTGR